MAAQPPSLWTCYRHPYSRCDRCPPPQAIHGSPFQVAVRPGNACVGNCAAYGDGLKHSSVGQTAHVGVRAYDAQGSAKLIGADAFVLLLYGPVQGGWSHHSAAREEEHRKLLCSAPVLSLRFYDHRNGTYTASYSLNTAGQYLLVLQEKVTGEQLPGSPFELTVSAGPVDIAACQLSTQELKCKVRQERIDITPYGFHGAEPF